MSIQIPIPKLPKPSMLHMFAEGRAIVELGMTSVFMPFLLRAPKGDNHPVMVLPGFLASDVSTKPLRVFLNLKRLSNLWLGTWTKSGYRNRWWRQCNKRCTD